MTATTRYASNATRTSWHQAHAPHANAAATEREEPAVLAHGAHGGSHRLCCVLVLGECGGGGDGGSDGGGGDGGGGDRDAPETVYGDVKIDSVGC